jgi:tRNA pseudouridine38-40 synthase
MSRTPKVIKLLIAYDGTDYSGWQRQRQAPSIQAAIEDRLQRMTTREVTLHGAGRTDAGVHAEGMVAHFATSAAITAAEFQKGLNSLLPAAIRIVQAEEVAGDFHARFSAKSKEYRYTLYTGRIQPPRLCRYSLHLEAVLDCPLIECCLELLVGCHDFSSFENSGTRDKSAVTGRGATRTLHSATLLDHEPELLVFQFIGDGFLRNMVRNIVGTLLEAGRGRLTCENFAEILAAKDRKKAGPTAPPHGLTLYRVNY